jgi:hypothetical protein
MNTRTDAANALLRLHDFIGTAQRITIAEATKGEEAQFFIDKIMEIDNVVKTMPRLYAQDGKGEEAIVYLHYFVGGCDWFISEIPAIGEDDEAFGLCRISEQELGYVYIPEITLNGAELDLHWEPKTFAKCREYLSTKA